MLVIVIHQVSFCGLKSDYFLISTLLIIPRDVSSLLTACVHEPHVRHVRVSQFLLWFGLILEVIVDELKRKEVETISHLDEAFTIGQVGSI